MTRDERQDSCVQKWLEAGHRATVEATTGFGKTRIGIKVINLLRRNDKTRTVIVVVPTLQLQQQWREVLTEYGCAEYTQVYVINSFVAMTKVRCSLLILDEIHRYAALTFSKVFVVCVYNFLLGLTATMSRLDRKHVLLQKYAPICDRVTTAECRKNRWISQMTEYNLGVEMSEEESEYYADLKKKFQKEFDKFADFGIMTACAGSTTPQRVLDKITGNYVLIEPMAVRRARMMGWRGHSVEEAYRRVLENRSRPRGQKLPVWGGNQAVEVYHPERMRVYALIGLRLNRQMKDFVYKKRSTIDTAEQLLKVLKMKTVTFAELIETADELASRFGSEAVVYHSEVKAAIIEGKKVTGAQRKRDALTKIKNGEARIICTAKSLDQGFDLPDAECGIIMSRTSSPTQYIQRRGRIVRKHTYEDGVEKEAVIINIYVKDTKDFDWLSKSQKGDVGIIWVDTVEEILENEGYMLQEL